LTHLSGFFRLSGQQARPIYRVSVQLAWLIADVEDAARLMGADYHAHGLEKNRRDVDVFCRSAFEDGLTRRRLTADDVFADFLKSTQRPPPGGPR